MGENIDEKIDQPKEDIERETQGFLEKVPMPYELNAVGKKNGFYVCSDAGSDKFGIYVRMKKDGVAFFVKTKEVGTSSELVELAEKTADINDLWRQFFGEIEKTKARDLYQQESYGEMLRKEGVYEELFAKMKENVSSGRIPENWSGYVVAAMDIKEVKPSGFKDYNYLYD